ncbi:MAG: hypothetical protein ACKOYH_03925 [Cyanobium sp.]
MKTFGKHQDKSHPLLLGFVLAVVVHSLVLSFLHLRLSQRKLPEPLKSRDNTPELLQFSSQPVPVTTIGVLPLPGPRLLPPPTSSVAEQKIPAGSNGRRIAKDHTKEVNKRSAPHQRSKTSALPTPTARTDTPRDLVEAVEELRALKHRSLLNHETGQGSDQQEMPKALPIEQQTLVESLWSQARSLSVSPGDGIQIRQLTPKQVQQATLPFHHRQMVVVENQLSLFWIEGQNYWILRSVEDPLKIKIGPQQS